MAEGRFISYLRVSTERQGRSGLGLGAQRKAVTDFLDGGRWELIAEFVEVESGKRSDRPKLAEALGYPAGIASICPQMRRQERAGKFWPSNISDKTSNCPAHRNRLTDTRPR